MELLEGEEQEQQELCGEGVQREQHGAGEEQDGEGEQQGCYGKEGAVAKQAPHESYLSQAD